MTDHLHSSSPSPDASQGSEAMSESPPGSPAGDPASPADDEPLFPVDGKFYSNSDRDHILSLPEIERESILADRAQQNLKKQQDEKLKQLLASKTSSKRKAAAADLDDDSRKSSRPKNDKAPRSALDDYKKAREAKGAERTSRFDAKRGRRRDSRSRSSASDRDADGESEVEWANTTTTRRDEPPAEMRDFERCRVGRTNFAKVCFYPNFEDTMKGCYARVSIGMNRDTGQNTYRMAQIKGFVEGKPYMLEAGPNAKSFTCDTHVIVAHGGAEKSWPLSSCSDSKITPDEFQRYIETMQKEKLRVPKKAALVQKLDDIHQFLNPSWNETALNQKFGKQREMEKRLNPANAAKMKKEAIMKRRAEGEDAHDQEEVVRCDAELAGLENNASNGVAARPVIKSSPAKAQTMSQQDRLALLNQKNRTKTSDEVRKALLEERRKRERAVVEAKAAAKAKKAAEEEARLQEAERVKEMGLLDVPGADMKELFGDLSDASRAGTPISGISTPKLRRSRQGTPMNGMPREKSKLGLGARKMKDGDGDELADLDLGIDVEI